MENFEAQQFRKNLANDLRETRRKKGGREDAKVKLGEAKKTEEYSTAKKLHEVAEVFPDGTLEGDISLEAPVLQETKEAVALRAICEQVNEYIRNRVFPLMQEIFKKAQPGAISLQEKFRNDQPIGLEEVKEYRAQLDQTMEEYSRMCVELLNKAEENPLAKLLWRMKIHRFHVNDIFEDCGRLAVLLDCYLQGIDFYSREKLNPAQKEVYKTYLVQKIEFKDLDLSSLLISPEGLEFKSVNLLGEIFRVVRGDSFSSEGVFYGKNIYLTINGERWPHDDISDSENKDQGRSASEKRNDMWDRLKTQKISVDLHDDLFDELVRELFKNSIAAMPNSGSIDINIKKQGEYAVITFTDTGEGIPPENLAKIFQEGFTTKPTGTGKGLSMIKTYIENVLNGKFEVASEVGKGTTFTIALPLSKKAEESS